MDMASISKDASLWMVTVPALSGQNSLFEDRRLLIVYLIFAFSLVSLSTWAFSVGGVAWKNARNHTGCVPVPGLRGLPIFGSLFSLSRGLAHHTLASMISSQAAKQLMVFSLGSTPVVVSSAPHTAWEILTSPHFANRPINQSAKMLMFDRGIGFAPNGAYWRLLRRIASSHLLSPKRIAAHEGGRQKDCTVMLTHISKEQYSFASVGLRIHLQHTALNNFMGSVFGKRYDVMHDSSELKELQELVREGFELLGAFNWSDHLPWMSYFFDPYNIKQRCAALVPSVRKLVIRILKEHRNNGSRTISDAADFVDVLLSLEGDDKLEENDMIAFLWEMIFRGVDTTALLTEWIMAELVLNPDKQAKLQRELDRIVGNKTVRDADVASLPYLQAVVKETLRIHPPGPLLSWARYSTSDVALSNGMLIPANTTAMVNMWAITHDSNVWDEPSVFKPERFLESEGGVNIDVGGNDLRLAPFGAGRRVCPGKNLGLAMVSLWVAKLVQTFQWLPNQDKPVDLTEVLKLSCEMRNPLSAVVVPRNVV